jgi:predicted dehydrogenase
VVVVGPHQERARALADRYGVPVFPRYDDLLDRCDAVAVAIPPAAQPAYATTAARRGKAVAGA